MRDGGQKNAPTFINDTGQNHRPSHLPRNFSRGMKARSLFSVLVRSQCKCLKMNLVDMTWGNRDRLPDEALSFQRFQISISRG